MRRTKDAARKGLWMIALLAALGACNSHAPEAVEAEPGAHGEAAEAEPPRGPHGGRLLADGDFAVELAIFETGVPPEFRAWITRGGQRVDPSDAKLRVTLTRLGGVKDAIGFAPQDDFLRGDTVVYEPHSFAVTVEARQGGDTHRWAYDNFEGRTRIDPAVAAAFGLETEVAGAASIRETVRVHGRIVPDPARVSEVSARFDGVIKSLEVAVGDTVRKGQALAVVESNESLKTYTITAPIGGTVTGRLANPGEQTAGRTLLTLMDTSLVWAELAIFPADLARVQASARVRVSATLGDIEREGVIARLATQAGRNQARSATVELDNADGRLAPGTYVRGEIHVAEHAVPLAVKRDGLQSFRDFTVVYARIGEEYEVRMLDLGRQDETWVEVLGGLEPGTVYVTANSYLVKADIEKSGASHDH